MWIYSFCSYEQNTDLSYQCDWVSLKLEEDEIWMRKSKMFISPKTLDHCAMPCGCTSVGFEGIAHVTGVSFTPINIKPPPSVSSSHHAYLKWNMMEEFAQVIIRYDIESMSIMTTIIMTPAKNFSLGASKSPEDRYFFHSNGHKLSKTII